MSSTTAGIEGALRSSRASREGSFPCPMADETRMGMGRKKKLAGATELVVALSVLQHRLGAPCTASAVGDGRRLGTTTTIRARRRVAIWSRQWSTNRLGIEDRAKIGSSARCCNCCRLLAASPLSFSSSIPRTGRRQQRDGGQLLKASYSSWRWLAPSDSSHFCWTEENATLSRVGQRPCAMIHALQSST